MRNRIMAAAVEKMRTQGIRFTMADLAASLGVSKRSLYEQFESKAQLISEIVDAIHENVLMQQKAIIARKDLPYKEKLRRILVVRPTVFVSTEGRLLSEIRRFLPAEWEKCQRFMARDWQIVEEFLQTGVASGEVRPAYFPVVEKMLRGAVNEIIDYQFLAKNNVSLEQVKYFMIDVLLYGLISRGENTAPAGPVPPKQEAAQK